MKPNFLSRVLAAISLNNAVSSGRAPDPKDLKVLGFGRRDFEDVAHLGSGVLSR